MPFLRSGARVTALALVGGVPAFAFRGTRCDFAFLVCATFVLEGLTLLFSAFSVTGICPGRRGFLLNRRCLGSLLGFA